MVCAKRHDQLVEQSLPERPRRAEQCTGSKSPWEKLLRTWVSSAVCSKTIDQGAGPSAL